jgi:glyoxylase-like metal-dependent hydrolase (beta-lactamase superfamily II)
MLMSRLFLALNPSPMTGAGNNTYLIDGAEPTLVDAGIGAAGHIDALAAALAGRPLARVIVTHGHADHASGVPALRTRWPGLDACKFVVNEPARPGGVDDDPGTWVPLADGQVVSAGDRTLVVVHTPGHARDHVCLWDAEERSLYAGDMVAIGTTIMVPAGRGGGMRAYLQSLQRLQALQPARIYPGHGPVIERPAELLAEFIAHRLMREAQVRACISKGTTAPADMVKEIYPELPAALVPAATATVEAHIEKLREDAL